MMRIKELMYGLLYLLVFTLPLTEGVKNFALILFILTALYASYKKILIPKIDFLNGVILLIPAMILCGSYFALDPKNTIRGLNSIVTMSVLFVYVRELEWDKKRVEYLLFSLFVGFFITILWGYYDWIYQGKKYLELHSVGHVNHSSIYMLLIFTISLIYMSLDIRELKKGQLYVIILVNVLAALSVFETGSRATMYALTGILVLFILYSSFNLGKRSLLFLCVTIVLGGFLIYLNLNDYMVSKFQQGIFYGSGREDIVIGFFESWLHHNKLFGIGLNNSFLINLKEYYNNYSISEILNFSHAHNTFMTYLVERGIIGLLLYLVFIFTILIALVKKFFLEPKNKLVLMGIFIWIINFIISFVNTTFHHENAILMLIVWAVALGSFSRTKNI